MKSIKIQIEQVAYEVVQSAPTLNLYKIFHPKGSFEMTRKHSGEWKVLMQTQRSADMPLARIGKAIEEKLGLANYSFGL